MLQPMLVDARGAGLLVELGPEPSRCAVKLQRCAMSLSVTARARSGLVGGRGDVLRHVALALCFVGWLSLAVVAVVTLALGDDQ